MSRGRQLAGNRWNWLLRNFRYNLRLSGWFPLALGALVLAGFIVWFSAAGAPMEYLRRAVEVVIPLAFGLHAAFAFAPENEPALEVLLSCPRSASRLLFGRLLTIGSLHAGVALLAALIITAHWNVESFGLALVRWLAAGIALGGLAAFTTQLTRQSAFGALMTTLLWASSAYGGDALLRRWSWVWPAHLYLQPEDVSALNYALNRLILLLAGFALMALAGVLLRNDERTLGSK